MRQRSQAKYPELETLLIARELLEIITLSADSEITPAKPACLVNSTARQLGTYKLQLPCRCETLIRGHRAIRSLISELLIGELEMAW